MTQEQIDTISSVSASREAYVALLEVDKVRSKHSLPGLVVVLPPQSIQEALDINGLKPEDVIRLQLMGQFPKLVGIVDQNVRNLITNLILAAHLVGCAVRQNVVVGLDKLR